MLKPLLVVMGPTGAGKSEFAIRIAECMDGEVVNCDSLQIYKHFHIGTAKVPPASRCSIPHHLLDILEPEEIFTAGDFGRVAREAVAEISARGKLPIVAGGTGFYLRALLDGLPHLPERNDALREKLSAREDNRPGGLHRILRRLDPVAAGLIAPRDVPKVMRALEIRLLTGEPKSNHKAKEALEGYEVTRIGLFPDRAELYARVNRRAEWMFRNGLMDEVSSLLNQGIPRTVKPFEALGYRQALRVFDGEMTVNEAIAETQLATRHYAKRQMTWFRKEMAIN